MVIWILKNVVMRSHFGKPELDCRVVSLLVMAFMFLSVLSGCGGVTPKPVYPTEVSSAIQAAFDVGETQYAAKDYQGALQTFQDFIANNPANSLTDEARYKIGKIFFLQNKFDEAVNSFETLFNQSPDSAYRAKASLMEGYVFYTMGNFPRALATLNRVETEVLPAKLQIQCFSLKILSAEKTESTDSENIFPVLRLADLYRENSNPELMNIEGTDLLSQGEVDTRISHWILSPMSLDEIPSWFKGYPSGYSRALLDYKWGKVYYEAGQTEDAKRKLRQFITQNPKNDYVISAQEILKNLGGTVVQVPLNTEPNTTIGVLLPLTGPQADYGKSILWSIECSAGKHEECIDIKNPKSNAVLNVSIGSGTMTRNNLVVRDTGTTSEQATSMVDELAKENVVAIIGPITGPISEAAARRAEELQIPILPITQKSGIMGLGKNIFQMGYLTDDQVKGLVAQARNRGLKSFGIFYPNNAYGQDLADRFEVEVKKSGGLINARAMYDPNLPNIADDVRRLKSGVSRISITSNSAPFDALFIPDSYRAINRITQALQVSGLTGLVLLGTNAWNGPQLSPTLAKLYPNSFFLDVFSSSSNQLVTARFVQAYKNNFSKTPTNIEALGFDATSMILQAAQEVTSKQVANVGEFLTNLSGFQGISQIDSFKQGIGPNVKPLVLTVTEQGIRVEK